MVEHRSQNSGDWSALAMVAPSRRSQPPLDTRGNRIGRGERFQSVANTYRQGPASRGPGRAELLRRGLGKTSLVSCSASIGAIGKFGENRRSIPAPARVE